MVGQPRTTQRRPAPEPWPIEQHLRARLRELARAHPRYGYRRMTTLLTREGCCVKRIQRGPELTANALRDWCRFSGSGTAYIEPGSPWENPVSSRSTASCATSCSTSKLAEDYRIEYNTYRPHSSLGQLTPAEFAERWQENQLGIT